MNRDPLDDFVVGSADASEALAKWFYFATLLFSFAAGAALAAWTFSQGG